MCAASYAGRDSDYNAHFRGAEQSAKPPRPFIVGPHYHRHMLRRLLAALVLAPLVTACASVNPQTFAPVIQSGQALVDALRDRPSLPAFRPLRQNYSSALATVRLTLQSSAERTIFGDYEVVDARLEEMLAVWTGLVDRDETMLPLAQPIGETLKARYALPVNTNEPPSVYASEALAALRDDITQRLTTAGEALRR